MVPNCWESGRVQDVISGLESGVSVNAEDRLKTQDEKAVLKISSVSYGKFNDKAHKTITDDYELSRARTSPKMGQIIISRANTYELVGASAYIEQDYNDLFVPDKLWQTISKPNIDMKWLSYILALDSSRYILSRLSTGTSYSMRNITKGELLTLKILIPPLPEQQKIAKILSTWDKAISTTEKLIATSKQQKKSLMQQLLTGKKRLLNPDTGKAFEGEWESLHIGEIARVKKGKALSSKYLEVGEFPVIAGGKTSPYKHSKYTHQDIITISASGAYAGFVAYHKHKIWASDCSVVEVNEKTITPFIFQFLLLNQTKIYSLQSGGAQPHIYPKDIDVLKIDVPMLDEQQKIASVLTAADKEIELLESKLAHLKQEKKALMQQLLTGKRRVKIDDVEVA